MKRSKPYPHFLPHQQPSTTPLSISPAPSPAPSSTQSSQTLQVQFASPSASQTSLSDQAAVSNSLRNLASLANAKYSGAGKPGYG